MILEDFPQYRWKFFYFMGHIVKIRYLLLKLKVLMKELSNCFS